MELSFSFYRKVRMSISTAFTNGINLYLFKTTDELEHEIKTFASIKVIAIIVL